MTTLRHSRIRWETVRSYAGHSFDSVIQSSGRSFRVTLTNIETGAESVRRFKAGQFDSAEIHARAVMLPPITDSML